MVLRFGDSSFDVSDVGPELDKCGLIVSSETDVLVSIGSCFMMIFSGIPGKQGCPVPLISLIR